MHLLTAFKALQPLDTDNNGNFAVIAADIAFVYVDKEYSLPPFCRQASY